jgi:hypothetical protein
MSVAAASTPRKRKAERVVIGIVQYPEFDCREREREESVR